jgi:hypothetical protein
VGVRQHTIVLEHTDHEARVKLQSCGPASNGGRAARTGSHYSFYAILSVEKRLRPLIGFSLDAVLALPLVVVREVSCRGAE